IGQEPGTDGFDVGHRAAIDVLGQPPQHDWRDVYSDPPPAGRRRGQCELAGPSADVNDRACPIQDTRFLKQADLLGGLRVLLGVIEPSVLLVEMLAAGMCVLVKPPRIRIVHHYWIVARSGDEARSVQPREWSPPRGPAFCPWTPYGTIREGSVCL